MAEVTPYPWDALDRLTRREIDATRRARAAFAENVSLTEIAGALRAITNAPVELSIPRIGLSPAVPAGTVDVWLTPDGDRSRIYVALEPGLVASLVTTMLGRAPVPHRPDFPPTAELVGSGSALLVALLRRVTSSPWRLSASRALPNALWVDLIALVGDHVYGAWIAAPVPTLAGPRGLDRHALTRLGEVPITLSVVAATGTTTREELALLDIGAAWLPGEGWTARPSQADTSTSTNGFEGSAWLAAGPSEAGIPVVLERGADGTSIVLSTGPAALPWVPPADPAPTTTNTDPRERASVEPADTVTDALESAPVVIRVEVGTVTMTAGEWARLSVGDVIGTGLRLGEPVTLRAGGAVYGRGELCEVEGELAVRLLSRGERAR